MKTLSKIQNELKAPKGQFNAFGKYKYRSCEDILEAVKPILAKYESTIVLSDKIVNIGNRFYVRANAYFCCGIEKVKVTAFARESEEKKGMDSAQVTGAASSYARKYALNGLLLIDDTKDSDSTNTGEEKKEKTIKVEKKELPWYNNFIKDKEMFKKLLETGQTGESILKAMLSKYKVKKELQTTIKNLTLENFEQSFK